MSVRRVTAGCEASWRLAPAPANCFNNPPTLIYNESQWEYKVHEFVHQRTDTADESERAQNLLLRQQNLHDLIVGCGQTLKTHRIIWWGLNHMLGYLMCVSVWYLQHVQWQLVGRRVRTLQRQKQTGLNTQTHTQRNTNTHWTQSLSSQCDNKWCSSWVHQVSSLQIIYNHQEMKTVLSFFCVLLVMKTSNINKLNDLKVVSLSSQTVLYYNRNIKWTSPPVWS